MLLSSWIMMKQAVEVTTKHSFIHTIARDYGVSVEFLDRRFWELRPRMRATIPVRDDKHLIKVQREVLRYVIERGYSPAIHLRMVNVETR